MNYTVKGDAGHDVDEQACDFIETVEYHGISPHGYCDGIVSEGETVGTDKESFRLRKDPY